MVEIFLPVTSIRCVFLAFLLGRDSCEVEFFNLFYFLKNGTLQGVWIPDAIVPSSFKFLAAWW